VELDRVAVALRPRGEWEALDLGFQMAREWWRPVWGVWLAVYLPVAALLLGAIEDRFYAVLVLWWLKPLFDRAVLYSASRSVFGETCGVLATLRAARDWLRPGLIAALSFHRFDLARSFTLPVWTLEKQTGSAARRRRAALGSRARGSAVWLTVVCAHLEWIAMFSILALVGMLEPGAADVGPDSAGWNGGALSFWEAISTWSLKDALLYAAAVSLVEPMYVTAGFALYLNRRTILEGWDIELQLRRIEGRLRAAAGAAMLLLAIVAAGALTAPQTALAAQDAEKSPQREIKAVLASPEFDQYREVTGWRPIAKSSAPREFRLSDAWRNFALLLADLSQGLLWAAAVIVVAAAVYALHRFLPEPRLRRRGAYRPPDTLFGLEVAPASLPEDVAAAAGALIGDNRLREALSLLYRGALSALVHRHAVSLHAGDTEGDCERAALRTLPQAGGEYFRRLVRAWQAAAYAGTPPQRAAVETLCRDWMPHFSAAAPS